MKRAANLFGEASGIAGISTNQTIKGTKRVVGVLESGYKKLERRVEVKNLQSDKVFKRVGGSQPVRVKKTPAEMERDKKRLKELGY